jgi:hypothetical protein
MRSSPQDHPPRTLERFGVLITELSEPPSGPSADNLITNEDSLARPTAELAARVPHSTVYLGVGPDQNFTFIAHARPRLAFIVDYRRRNLLLHLLHKALFTLAPDRPSYLQMLCARQPDPPLPREVPPAELVEALRAASFERALLEEAIAQVARFLQPARLLDPRDLAELASIQTRLARSGLDARFLPMRGYPSLAQLIQAEDCHGRPAHHLATDPLFQAVRQLQLQHRIIPLVGDYAGSSTLPRLARWLDSNQQKVGLIYASDMEWFLLRNHQFPPYIENLERLPRDPHALILRTSTRPINHRRRHPPDQCTSFLEPLDHFLARVRQIHPFTVDDLFPAEAGSDHTPLPKP